jgi:threonine/homoserine/homoserine lactone efflux protein
LGNVAVTNALQGTQYIFLFIMVLVLSSKYPKFLKEEAGRDILFQKIIGGLLIGIGLYMLAVNVA